jgi:hypothetical protein
LTFAFLKLYMSHKTLAISVKKLLVELSYFTNIRLQGVGHKAEFNILMKINRCKPQ